MVDAVIRPDGTGRLPEVGGLPVEDGVEGAQRLSLQTFDLVITDMRMPGLDGGVLIAAARRFQRLIRIIASGDEGSLPPLDPAVFARRLGAHAALPKPYRVAEFCSAIAMALGERSAG